MDTSEMRVPLQGAVKIFEAGIMSKTWDIHGMPQFITTTHREGCETCNAYAVHVVKASELSTVEIPSREVKKAFRIAWPNVVHHLEDEASSESDKKVEWYSDQLLRVEYLSSGVVRKDTSARYPEVLNRVWLQLMCCALLINQVPNFRARSKVRARLEKERDRKSMSIF